MVEKLKRDGYRLHMISPYAVDGTEHYASLWSKEGGPEWQARYGLTRDDYQKTLDALIKDGYRMTGIGVHEIGGSLAMPACSKRNRQRRGACNPA
jgi:hypothetical protein